MTRQSCHSRSTNFCPNRPATKIWEVLSTMNFSGQEIRTQGWCGWMEMCRADWAHQIKLQGPPPWVECAGSAKTKCWRQRVEGARAAGERWGHRRVIAVRTTFAAPRGQTCRGTGGAEGRACKHAAQAHLHKAQNRPNYVRKGARGSRSVARVPAASASPQPTIGQA